MMGNLDLPAVGVLIARESQVKGGGAHALVEIKLPGRVEKLRFVLEEIPAFCGRGTALVCDPIDPDGERDGVIAWRVTLDRGRVPVSGITVLLGPNGRVLVELRIGFNQIDAVDKDGFLILKVAVGVTVDRPIGDNLAVEAAEIVTVVPAYCQIGARNVGDDDRAPRSVRFDLGGCLIPVRNPDLLPHRKAFCAKRILGGS